MIIILLLMIIGVERLIEALLPVAIYTPKSETATPGCHIKEDSFTKNEMKNEKKDLINNVKNSKINDKFIDDIHSKDLNNGNSNISAESELSVSMCSSILSQLLLEVLT